MLQKNYLKSLRLFLLSSLLILSGCGFNPFEKEVIVETRYIRSNIQIQERPKPIKTHDVYFYVVNERNLNEFLKRFEKENGELVFYAISVVDYENFSLNMGEIKRLLQQQKELILYYETNINKDKNKNNKE